jgi:PIN domain nuclease of toxin-antitoxin system
MRLLLDTHIFLALLGSSGAANLPAAAVALLADDQAEPHLSAASLWEIAIKCRLGKLKLQVDLDALPEIIGGLGIRIVAINELHALAALNPEPMTRDPFDRMLLAQCQIEGFKLVTIDRALVSHPLAASMPSAGAAKGRR